MNATEITELFAWNLRTLERNLAGLQPDDFLIRVGEDGSHLNWILGHVLYSRRSLLATLDPDARTDDLEAIKAAYVRGSKASNAEALPSARIIEQLRASQETLTHTLNTTDLSRPDPRDGTLADKALFLAWHETYHVGQAGLLRRLAGKPGAI